MDARKRPQMRIWDLAFMLANDAKKSAQSLQSPEITMLCDTTKPMA